MENQVISTFGSAIWILVQVACIAFTAFCAILLGAIQLERAKGAPVHTRATDWTVYLLLVIIAGCGLITLMFMDPPPVAYSRKSNLWIFLEIIAFKAVLFNAP